MAHAGRNEVELARESCIARIGSTARHWLSLGSIAALCLVAPFAAPSPTTAAELLRIDNAARVGKLNVVVDKSRTLRLSQPFAEALIANPGLADVVPLTDQSIYVIGKKPGTTRLTFLAKEKQLLGVVEIEIGFDVRALEAELRNSVPAGYFDIRSANGRILLNGSVPDAPSVGRAIEIVEQFTAACGPANDEKAAPANSAPNGAQVAAPQKLKKGKCYSNGLTVRATQQVLLEVRFIEAQRTASRELGFGLDVNGSRVVGGYGAAVTRPAAVIGGLLIPGASALASNSIPFGNFVARVLNGGTTADVLIQALEKRGLVRRLAEPNLSAMSGDTANFLAGGEFPFPVAEDDNKVTVAFKKFGVGLAFTPTVLADGQINLKIEPEVSDIDPSQNLRFNNVTIPSLIVRRAKTTVELRNGQSFAIAGLFQSTNIRNRQQLPWIGKVPVLGALFSSAAFEKKESDLVIIVTPRLVRPAAPHQRLIAPTDRSLPSNDRDYFLRSREEVPRQWPAQYGHILSVQAGWTARTVATGGNRGAYK